MRTPKVLFAICGKVIGHTETGLPRPDVAAAIHPNLSHSGWSAQLSIDLMPHCEDAKLTTWAVAPIGSNIFRLTGEYVPPHRDEERTDTNAMSILPFRPGDNPRAAPEILKFASAPVAIRKCPASSCEIVAQLSTKEQVGFVIERRKGWRLVQIDRIAGWIGE